MKPILTKAEVRGYSDYKMESDFAEECLDIVQCILNRIEENNHTTVVQLFALGDLVWTGGEWLLHGDRFDGDKLGFQEVVKRDIVLEELFDRTGWAEECVIGVIEYLDEAIDSKLATDGGKMREFDFFGRGVIATGGKLLKFISLDRLISDDPVNYIRGLNLKIGEGFTLARGSSLKELDEVLCSEIFKKLKIRIKKKSGETIGAEIDPIFIPRGVSSVSSKTLDFLSKHRGLLDLTSLSSLDEHQALALSGYQGCVFSDGSGRWQVPEMRRCGLTLGGIKSLSEKAAANLSKFSDDEPAWVSELKLARPAEYCKTAIIHDFSGLKTVSVPVLKSLVKLGGHLDLSGIENLEKEQALILGTLKGGLFLGGLQSITAEVAEALSKIRGGETYGLPLSRVFSCHEIRLDHLHDVSEEVMEGFRDFGGVLALGKIRHLTVGLAKKIKDHPCFIRVEIMAYEAEAKSVLEHRWDLEFPS